MQNKTYFSELGNKDKRAQIGNTMYPTDLGHLIVSYLREGFYVAVPGL